VLNEIGTLGNTPILREVEIHLAVIPSRAQHNNAKCQHGNKKHIEDAEEDKSISNRNLISAVIKTIGDGVQEPEEDGPASEYRVVAMDLQTLGRDKAGAKEGGGEEEVGDCAVGEKAPFIVRRGHGAGKPGRNPGPAKSDIEGDGCPADAGDKAQGNDQRGPAHKPLTGHHQHAAVRWKYEGGEEHTS
jgi:hypothetical protein